MQTATLVLRILSDVAGATTGLDATAGRVDKLNSTMRGLQGPALGVVSTLGAAAIATGRLASEAEQNAGAVDAIFGAHAAGVKANAAAAADGVGLSTSSYNQLAAVLGSQLKNGGTAMDEIAGKTDHLVSQAADMAAAFGGSTADAVGALSSALRGERDPIEKYGVSLTQAAVDAKAAELGFTKVGGALSAEANQAATLSLIMDQTAAVHGQFAREGDTAAGAAERATARLANASAEIGAAFLPAMTAASEALSGFAGWVSQNSDLVLILGGVVGALALGVIGYNAVMTAMPAIQAGVTAAQWLWNAALTANPIGIVVVAIAALVGAIIWLWTTNDAFRNALIGAWNAIVGAVQAAARWITTDLPAGFARAKEGAISQALQLLGWVAGLPGRIAGAIGNLGNLLLGAGRSILDGLQRGLEQKWRDVQNFVGGMGRWIAANKGPISYDLRLLQPAGTAIMTGLIRSLAGEMPNLRRLLATVTNEIAGTSADLDASLNIQPTAANPSRSAPTVNITVNGALDARGVAAQVRDLLTSDARIRGVISTGGVALA